MDERIVKSKIIIDEMMKDREFELIKDTEFKLKSEIMPYLLYENKNKTKTKILFQKKEGSQKVIRSIMKELGVIESNEDVILIIITLFNKKDNTNVLPERYIEIENNFDNIQFFPVTKMLFNITKHRCVPRHKILKKEELEEVKKKWGNNFLNQIAKIKKNDPVAKYFFAQEGDVFEISNNADYINYRICTKL